MKNYIRLNNNLYNFSLNSNLIKYTYCSSNDITFAGGATTAGQVIATGALSVDSSTQILGASLRPQAYADRYYVCVTSTNQHTVYFVLMARGTYTNPFTTQVQGYVLYI